MKKLFVLLTLCAGMLVGASNVDAKDKYDDWPKKVWKETRDDIRELREQYERLSDNIRHDGASRRVRENAAFIGADVRRISDQFDRGYYDMRDLRNRITRADDAIRQTRKQMEMERKYYRR